jgi:glutathione S-transferase
MKFYDFPTAPNPRRARIFIAEKGISIENVMIDLAKGEQFSEAFKKVNPRCTVPVLELDDGTAFADNIAIARYLEEIHPAPPLLGTDPVEKATVEGWNARIEYEGLHAVADYFRNSNPMFNGHAMAGQTAHEQIPALAERGRTRSMEFLQMLNGHLEGREFICTDRYTMADITALVSVDLFGFAGLPIGDDLGNLKRWHAAVSARPSAKA